MRCEKMDSFKRKENDDSEFMNPFNYDLVRMGVEVGKNVTVMYSSHDYNKDIIIVNNKTGERLKIVLDE